MFWCCALLFASFVSADCPSGSYSKEGACKQCPIQCKKGSCLNEKGCVECIAGFYPNEEGICFPCITNCEQCSGSSFSRCARCNVGFFRDNRTKTCFNASTCSSFKDFDGCETCKDGFVLRNGYCEYYCEGCEEGFCTKDGCIKCSNWFLESDKERNCKRVSRGKLEFVVVALLFISLVFVGVIALGIVGFVEKKAMKKFDYQQLN